VALADRQAWNFYHPSGRLPLADRERVSPRVDPFDCLLALWIAEAMLCEGRERGEGEEPR